MLLILEGLLCGARRGEYNRYIDSAVGRCVHEVLLFLGLMDRIGRARRRTDRHRGQPIECGDDVKRSYGGSEGYRAVHMSMSPRKTLESADEIYHERRRTDGMRWCKLWIVLIWWPGTSGSPQLAAVDLPGGFIGELLPRSLFSY